MAISIGQYTTIEEAQKALRDAEHDVMMDFGEEAVEAGFSDLVDSIAIDCTPAVAAELRRRERGW